MDYSNILKNIEINKEETDTYIKYSIKNRADASPTKASELLITAHGGFNSRTQYFPANKSISFYAEHGFNLVSEVDSTLRRVTQARAIARENYPVNSNVVNYNLSDVTDYKGYFHSKYFERKDFIKAILLESYLYNLKNVYEKQQVNNRLNPNLLLSKCPDILMIKDDTCLYNIVYDPRNAQYQKILASFCRGNGSRSRSMRAIELNNVLSSSPQRKIEEAVYKEIQRRGIGEPASRIIPITTRTPAAVPPPTRRPMPVIPTARPREVVVPVRIETETRRVGRAASRPISAPTPAATTRAPAPSTASRVVVARASRERDLRNRDFKNRMLDGVDLSNADLSNADFTGADLSNANLSGSDLSWTKFNNTKLYRTNFWNSNLSNTNFMQANFIHDNYTQADIFRNSNPVFLCYLAKKWDTPHYTPLGDSKNLGFNVMIPTILKLEDITQSGTYRYVILANGEIRLGYKDNRHTRELVNPLTGQLKREVRNFTPNGRTEIASHGGLANYQNCVIGAGEMNIECYRGMTTILSINNLSGHYKPDANSVLISGAITHRQYAHMCNHTSLEALRSNGVRDVLVQVGTIG